MKTAIILFLALLVFPFALFSESLSDINEESFVSKSKAHALKSPFLKEEVAPEELMLEDLYLTGILYSPGSKFALISGYTIKEGDEIAGFKVSAIKKDRVILKQFDQIEVLRLGF